MRAMRMVVTIWLAGCASAQPAWGPDAPTDVHAPVGALPRIAAALSEDPAPLPGTSNETSGQTPPNHDHPTQEEPPRD